MDKLVPQVDTPPKTFPQEHSGDPQDSKCEKSAPTVRVSILYMADNPERANIQVVVLRTLYKYKNRAEAICARRRVSFMGVGSTLPNNPEKGRACNHKTNNADRILDVLTMDNKFNRFIALDGT